MNKIHIFLRIILSLPKTMLFNFITFDLKTALLLPVYIDMSVKVKKTYKGAVIIDSKCIYPFMIKIGIGGSEAINNKRGIFYMNKKYNGHIIFKGKAKFGTGIVLYNNKGISIFGINFSCNKNCFISCDSNLKFGNDVLLGWNINIRDSDGHSIMYEEKKSQTGDIYIGNHVWICSFTDILKGTKIGDNCVIGYRSLVCGLNCDEKKLIAGTPAKIIKNNIDWEK